MLQIYLVRAKSSSEAAIMTLPTLSVSLAVLFSQFLLGGLLFFWFNPEQESLSKMSFEYELK